ncbi:MAG: glycosyltransferase family 1 protein, partial [Candidatus Omnitrophota bacterium]
WQMALAAGRCDLFHVPHFNVPVLGARRLVVTIHDLIYLREPASKKTGFARWYLDVLFKTIQKKASAVLTVSEATKRDLLDYLPKLNPSRVSVTPEAASDIFKPITNTELSDRVRKIYGLHRPFVLFVGTLKPHKNAVRLIEAMAQLRTEKKSRHELLIIGRYDPDYPEPRKLIGANADWVHHYERVADEDLAVIYNLAECLVLPSSMEGFGLPVLEAMQCGTPVALARKSSLPEVGGEAAIYFDPASADSIGEAVLSLVTDSELRGALSRQGLERARQFSWQRTAELTLEAYRKVLG